MRVRQFKSAFHHFHQFSRKKTTKQKAHEILNYYNRVYKILDFIILKIQEKRGSNNINKIEK